MYQLQREYFIAKTERLTEENKKNTELFDKEVIRIMGNAEEFMKKCQSMREDFMQSCEKRLMKFMWQHSSEFDQLKSREERRIENRREKRLRRKQRKAQAKSLNQIPVVNIDGEE